MARLERGGGREREGKREMVRLERGKEEEREEIVRLEQRKVIIARDGGRERVEREKERGGRDGRRTSTPGARKMSRNTNVKVCSLRGRNLFSSSPSLQEFCFSSREIQSKDDQITHFVILFSAILKPESKNTAIVSSWGN